MFYEKTCHDPKYTIEGRASFKSEHIVLDLSEVLYMPLYIIHCINTKMNDELNFFFKIIKRENFIKLLTYVSKTIYEHFNTNVLGHIP